MRQLNSSGKMELGRFEKLEQQIIALKKRKVFVPAKKPRLLPGDRSKAELKSDLKAYNRHLFNCFYAEPFVDDKPPKMNPQNYVNLSTLRSEAMRLEQIDTENKALVQKINYINRMGGKVDTFNPFAYESCSRWEAHKRNMQKIARDNTFFYDRLVTTESKYPKAEFDKDWAKNVEKLQHMAKYTLQMFLTKTVDQLVNEMPSISNLESTCLMRKTRPHCYMDFRIKDGIPMGRLIIELYDDVAPKTCKNFLALCKGKTGLSYKSCKVFNVVKGQYFETGDVTLNNGKGGCSIYGETFPEEEHVLKHTRPGVLSMVPVYKVYNNSKFSITFDALEQLDKKRVAFGRVVKGMKTVYHIQDLGRKVGAPVVPVIIAKCGEVKPSKGCKRNSFHGNSKHKR